MPINPSACCAVRGLVHSRYTDVAVQDLPETDAPRLSAMESRRAGLAGPSAVDPNEGADGETGFPP
jgi:hypothetical protein